MENTEVNTTTTTSAPETSAPAPTAKRTRKPRTPKVEEKKSRIVTATLAQRQVRVQFKRDGKIVHTSPTYKSRNILSKIVAFARSTSKGAASGATAIAQVPDGKKWVTVTE